MDETILENIHSTDKYNQFLKYWINENETKAVVCISHWKTYFKKWEANLKSVGDEIKKPFFGSIRGVATPYRDGKYGVEAEENSADSKGEINSIEKTVEIVNRHYATVQYLLSEQGSNYKDKKLTLSSDRILTLKGFYTEMETQNNGFVQKFLTDYGEN